MPIRAIFSEGIDTLTVTGLTQWDYGQKLEIHGLALPALIEVHFACLEMAEAPVRIGTTVDGVTTVAIPDSCLEHDTPLRAWVYVIDTVSGRTEKTIMLPITARTKPQGADSRQPFVADEYKEAIDQINKTVHDWRDGIVDQHDGGKTKIWTGTRAEFNQLQETDARTLYVITDELPDYTDLVELYAAYAAQCAKIQKVLDGEQAVPKAKTDEAGRDLACMLSSAAPFNKVTRLTEDGVYQMYIDCGHSVFIDNQLTPVTLPLPLVSFSPNRDKGQWITPLREDSATESTNVSVVIMPSGFIHVQEGVTVYARKVGPFSGWAVG